ncbi:hypothetical protein P6B95_01805 [Streptomyces atratus]|uniref:ornithine cyclodeaminase n=1 Tax=Streptomyces atratus TaxID=1893 RepID=UPI001670C0A5|nr:ornithine cyclodeaminase [Streptomyces atratus]WPW26311.1 hypothetical protein P6B95_01805 [Streptomyces atratus]GGT65858.1 ornithine cyclodeaminase [Streptomyces atratus]
MSGLMRMVDGPDVTALVTQQDALAAAREAALAAAVPGRVVTGRVQVDWDQGESGTRFLVVALPDLGVFGYKQFHWIGDGVHYACHLFSTEDGAPLGVVDAAALTTLRTAATAALGVQALHRGSGDATVAVIGSGAEARAGLRALAAVTDIGEARVTSRNPANREAFAADMATELGLKVVAVDSVRAAVKDAHIAYSATASNGPVVYRAQDIEGLPVLASIGSTAPDQREAAGDVFTSAGVVLIDTTDALHESGDLIEARDRFGFDSARALLLGTALEVPPTAADDRTAVFKSIGSPEQDVVLALHILRRAEQQERGRLVQPAMSRKQNL